MENQVTALDFDGCFGTWVSTWLPGAEIADLTCPGGCRLACDPDCLSAVRKCLLQRQVGPFVLLGSGDYHQFSHLLLERIETPFSLVLFDNHSDLMPHPFEGDLLACGSWLRSAIDRIERLEQVLLVGADPETLMQVPDRWLGRLVYLPLEELPLEVTRRLPPPLRGSRTLLGVRERSIGPAMEQALSQIVSNTLYISVDKDVLCEEEARTHWSQGQMQLSELADAVAFLESTRTVVGMDICGEIPVDPVAMLRPHNRRGAELNATANLALLAAAGVCC